MPAYDVVILGGGPAGAIAGIGLARLGHRVAVLARGRRHPLWEGLAPRAFEGLQRAGCERALAAVGDEVVRRATWDGATREANRERLVERIRFDAALREDAAGAGVAVHAASVLSHRETSDGWRVTARGPAGALSVGAPYLVEARGRGAPLLGARRHRGPPTTALCRAFRLPPGTRAMTALTAFANGWAWLALGPDRRGVLQLLISSERGELAGGGTIDDRFDRLLADVEEAPGWLDGAQPIGKVWTRNAAPMLVTPAAHRRRLRVGDAAAAIDPLSGHGLFEAIGAALAAAPVMNTLIRLPDRAELALRFYGERVEQGFWRHCRVGRELYASEGRWPGRPFWSRRRAWPDGRPAHPPLDAAPPRIERRPVVADGLVTEAAVVVTPDHPRGVWQVAGVPVAALLEALEETGHDRVRAARRLRRRPDELGTAMDWLTHRGLLTRRPTPA